MGDVQPRVAPAPSGSWPHPARPDVCLINNVGLEELVRGVAGGRLGTASLLGSSDLQRETDEKQGPVCLRDGGGTDRGSGCPSFPGNQGALVHCLSFTRASGLMQGPGDRRGQLWPVLLSCSSQRVSMLFQAQQNGPH